MTPLEEEIRRLIAVEGPLPVERYMALCLAHPVHGYYRNRDPLGLRGDFTTAPEISQMFGELLGLWAAEVWGAMGAPERLRLVELGPGRGTLMSDMLRAARVLPPFRAALDVHLVETSPALRERQRAALRGVEASWHDAVEDVPDGPAIVVANEFFDALPIRQYAGTARGWCERMVGLVEGRLAFGIACEPDPGVPIPVREGAVLEVSPASDGILRHLARRLAAQGGALLAVDYGHARAAFGDTLQAVRRHAYADPLVDPGEADLTAHVNFAALAQAARESGAAVHGPEPQGGFLHALGLLPRAEALKRRATPHRVAAVDAAVSRLAGRGEGEMGELFKVLCVADPRIEAVPGLARG